jgi:hypothetical protein
MPDTGSHIQNSPSRSFQSPWQSHVREIGIGQTLMARSFATRRPLSERFELCLVMLLFVLLRNREFFVQTNQLIPMELHWHPSCPKAGAATIVGRDNRIDSA